MEFLKTARSGELLQKESNLEFNVQEFKCSRSETS
jgi:hypothetical protein